MGNTKL
jgi:hypothetical protein